MRLTARILGSRRDSCDKQATNANAHRSLSATLTFLVGRRRSVLIFVLSLGIGMAVGGAGGAEAESGPRTSASMLSLDEQVQEVKSDLLAIAAELSNLEEKLLYPSNTQISLFVSIEEGHAVALDSARVLIDGELVAQHVYSFKELEALQKGGVQRIYTGNIQTGEHRLEVSIAGKREGGKDFDAVETFVFNKAVDPKLVGIRLANRSSGDATIAIEGW